MRWLVCLFLLSGMAIIGGSSAWVIVRARLQVVPVVQPITVVPSGSIELEYDGTPLCFGTDETAASFAEAVQSNLTFCDVYGNPLQLAPGTDFTVDLQSAALHSGSRAYPAGATLIGGSFVLSGLAVHFARSADYVFQAAAVGLVYKTVSLGDGYETLESALDHGGELALAMDTSFSTADALGNHHLRGDTVLTLARSARLIVNEPLTVEGSLSGEGTVYVEAGNRVTVEGRLSVGAVQGEGAENAPELTFGDAAEVAPSLPFRAGKKYAFREAKWRPVVRFALRYHAGDGTLLGGRIDGNAELTSEMLEGYAGCEISWDEDALPKPQRKGYTFVGWQTEQELKIPEDFEEDDFILELHAAWMERVYPVQFLKGALEADDIVLPAFPATVSLAEGEDTIDLNDMNYRILKENFITDWQANIGGMDTDAHVFRLLQEHLPDDDEGFVLTLTAQWRPGYLLKILNRAEGVIWWEEQLECDDSFVAGPREKEGYVFLGWYTNVTSGDPVKLDGLSGAEFRQKLGSSMTVISEWRTLFYIAQFQVGDYAAAGIDAWYVTIRDVVDGVPYTITLPTPTAKPGYRFLGWHLEGSPDLLGPTYTLKENTVFVAA